MSDYKKIRILFGVPEGDYFSRQFASVAAAMPDSECLFLAFSWSTGLDLRKSKLNFAHIPWKHTESQNTYELPPVTEFIARGYFQHAVPASAKEAFAALGNFIEKEISCFAPDIVVLGPVDNSICYLINNAAKIRKIPRLCLITSFIADHFIVQPQVDDWIDFLKKAEIPDSITGSRNISDDLKLRALTRSKVIWKKQMWIRGLERLIRVGCAGVTFDTLQSLGSRVVSKIAPTKWFPNNKTLESTDDVQPGYVLVALNQPAQTSWDNPTWIDLINLALEATPEGTPIVIRPHPSETARKLPKELEKVFSSRGVLISRAGHGPSLTTLVQQCKAVMTLNSATGMEALFAGKLVFTLGSAFYARPGMAINVTTTDYSVIREMLINPEKYSPVMSEVYKFTNWLIDNHIVSSPQINSTIGKTLADCIRTVVNNAHTSK